METIHHVLEYCVEGIELVGIAIMLVGALKFLVIYLQVELSRLARYACIHELMTARRVLGSYILAGLEFLIVADVIETMLVRDLNNLYHLGAIVIIRTAISHFLGKELAELEESSAGATERPDVE